MVMDASLWPSQRAWPRRCGHDHVIRRTLFACRCLGAGRGHSAGPRIVQQQSECCSASLAANGWSCRSADCCHEESPRFRRQVDGESNLQQYASEQSFGLTANKLPPSQGYGCARGLHLIPGAEPCWRPTQAFAALLLACSSHDFMQQPSAAGSSCCRGLICFSDIHKACGFSRSRGLLGSIGPIQRARVMDLMGDDPDKGPSPTQRVP